MLRCCNVCDGVKLLNKAWKTLLNCSSHSKHNMFCRFTAMSDICTIEIVSEYCVVISKHGEVATVFKLQFNYSVLCGEAVKEAEVYSWRK